VINGILVKAGLEPVEDDMEFISKAEQIALSCGYGPIEFSGTPIRGESSRISSDMSSTHMDGTNAVS
jgi:gamma-glutamylcysteine synthetase